MERDEKIEKKVFFFSSFRFFFRYRGFNVRRFISFSFFYLVLGESS